MEIIYGKDEKGLFHQDEDDDEKYYFKSPLILEQFNELTNDQKFDYAYAQSAGRYDDYDGPAISALLEELAKARHHLKEILAALDLATLSDFGCRDKIGQGYDERILEARNFSNRFKA